MRKLLFCCIAIAAATLISPSMLSAQPATASPGPVETKIPSNLAADLKKYPGVVGASLFGTNLRVDISPGFADSLTEDSFDDWQSGIFGLFTSHDVTITGLWTVVREPEGKLLPIEKWMPRRRLPAELQAAGGGLACTTWGKNLVMRYPLPLPYGGALTGKTIVLSPGHGLTPSGSGWGFQRSMVKFEGCGSCAGIIEDLSNAQIANRYLIPVLLRAGARVYSPRELDDNTNEVIVDDGGPGYEEKGADWSVGMSEGGYGTGYRTLAPDKTGSAQFTPELPAEGWYWVSTRYVSGTNRSTATRFIINHAGGSNVMEIDQRTDGSRWIYLGQFWMIPGQKHGVRIEPSPGNAGYVIADAVRFGGGIHADSKYPRWQMSAEQNLSYLGAPSSTYSGGDVGARPLYAEWQGADLFLSIHSNATGTTSQRSGTSTYRYNCGTHSDHTVPKPGDSCDDPPGSKSFQRIIHDSFVKEMRDSWDPSWRDFDIRYANFGELRNLDKIPGVLIETAFHDNTVTITSGEPLKMSDNRALQEPGWRRTAAMAMYKGILKFLNPDGVVVPDTPVIQSVTTEPTSSGVGVRARWQAVTGAKGYRVYIAKGGPGFDGTKVVKDTDILIEATPGEPVYVQVAALNEGGESLPSEVLGASSKAGVADKKQIMIVQGFDREDAWTGENGNTKNYIIQHGGAIAAAGWGFHSATNEVVASKTVELGPYTIVDWLLGEEATVDKTFDSNEQEVVTQYVSGGGKLLATGAEIGYELVEKAVAPTFLTDVFGAKYEEDNAKDSTINSPATSVFGSLPAMQLDDGTKGTYPADAPDVFSAAKSGASTALQYGNGKSAAVAYDNGETRTVLTGFPLEVVQPQEARNALTEAILKYLSPEGPPIPIDPPPDAGSDSDLPDEGVAGQGGSGNADAGTGGRAGSTQVDSGADGDKTWKEDDSGGCGCQLPGSSQHGNHFWLIVGAAALTAAMRRRKAH